jgi:hypothetical protein
MTPRRIEPVISDRVRVIHDKLLADRTGDSLTRAEKALEVTREEAAYLLSALAGRTISTEYLRQLTRGDKPRLVPSRATGNTYMYQVDALLTVRFTRAHKQSGESSEEAA